MINFSEASFTSIRRFTGFCGISAFIALLLALSFTVMSGVHLSPILRYMLDGIYPQQHPQIESFAQYSLWLFIFTQILLIGFASGFHQMFGSHHWSIALTTRLLHTALVLFIVVALVTIGISKGLAQVVYSSKEISDTLRGTAQSFIAFRNYAGTLAGVLVAISCLGFGYIFRNSSYIISIWIISAGLLGLCGAFWPMWLDLSYLRNAGYLLFLGWISGISLIILQKKTNLYSAT